MHSEAFDFLKLANCASIFVDQETSREAARMAFGFSQTNRRAVFK